jgi:hypothetical protein
MRFRQFEVVRLIHGMPEAGIAPGTLAVVIDVRDADPSLPSTAEYELEIRRPGMPLHTASAGENALAPLLTPGRHELWIMPGYACHSFWATDGTTSGVHDNVSAASLKLSPALVADVTAWEAEYDAAHATSDPAAGSTGYSGSTGSSGFASAAAEAAFRRAGRAIANRVAAELGSGWSVVYRYGATEDPDRFRV